MAGFHNNKVIAPIFYQGTMDSTLFNFWLSNFLLPEIGKGKRVIMDNAAFHKSQETETIINDAWLDSVQTLDLPVNQLAKQIQQSLDSAPSTNA